MEPETTVLLEWPLRWKLRFARHGRAGTGEQPPARTVEATGSGTRGANTTGSGLNSSACAPPSASIAVCISRFPRIPRSSIPRWIQPTSTGRCGRSKWRSARKGPLLPPGGRRGTPERRGLSESRAPCVTRTTSARRGRPGKSALSPSMSRCPIAVCPATGAFAFWRPPALRPSSCLERSCSPPSSSSERSSPAAAFRETSLPESRKARFQTPHRRSFADREAAGRQRVRVGPAPSAPTDSSCRKERRPRFRGSTPG